MTRKLREDPELRGLFLEMNRQRRGAKREKDNAIKERDKAIEMSYLDGLTGVFNQRYLTEVALPEEKGRYDRYDRTGFAYVLLDTDDFKLVNDAWGHPEGDRVLKELALVLKKAFRDVDITGRYGGEEFYAILPETTEKEAYAACERARTSIKSYNFGLGKPVTASFGISTYPNDASTAEELVKHADVAMYAAKGGGKNRVCTYSGLKKTL